jgi:aryl-alcohol dehydrogenase-like predicted oxidoreductase
MEYRELGKTGFSTSFIGFGALEIGRNWGLGGEIDKKRPTENEAQAVLEGVLGLGINLIDTASAYHLSEERIGKYLSQRRAEFFLATKCGEHSKEPSTYYDFSYEAVRDSIDRSLKLLRTDQIDLIQIHFGPDPWSVLKKGVTLKAMKEAKEKGKVRFLGASPPLELLDACIESGAFDCLQIAINLLDRRAEPAVEKCRKKGIGVLVRSGFAMGRLTPKVEDHLEENPQVRSLLELLAGDLNKLSQLALGYLHSLAGVSTVLVGTKNLKHLQEHILSLEQGYDSELVERAKDVLEKE